MNEVIDFYFSHNMSIFEDSIQHESINIKEAVWSHKWSSRDLVEVVNKWGSHQHIEVHA